MQQQRNEVKDDFRILSLDGGGSKGVYTLGVLKEVEALLGHKLCEEFELVYGTSTGAIIAALIALGHTVEEITKIYFEIIPDIMQHKRRRRRSEALKTNVERILGDLTFEQFQTDVGIVSLNLDLRKPMVFKSSVGQAHGRASTFVPGFGCAIAQAILASTAAYPFFEPRNLKTLNQGDPEVVDGGFVANNPTLLAIADAVEAFEVRKEDIKVLSVGVGKYNEPRRNVYYQILFNRWVFKLVFKLLEASSNTVEQLRVVLFPDVQCIRIDESFAQNEYATDLLESDETKLKKLHSLGRESFAKFEGQLKAQFGWH